MSHATSEWIYIGVVCALLVYVGAESWNIERLLEDAPAEAKTIKVIGQQWFWSFEHEDGSKEVNQLTVQKGVPYKFELISQDVIHAFNIPDYTVMLDVVPGRLNVIWSTFDVPGEYLIQCREYCGFSHYNMKAKLFVVDGPVESEKTATAASATTSAATTAATTTAAAPVEKTDATLEILAGSSAQGNPDYKPDALTVTKGNTILVKNDDSVPHSVTSGTGPTDPESAKLFDTSLINAGESSVLKTDSVAAGEHAYYCMVHPYMTGTLTVQ